MKVDVAAEQEVLIERTFDAPREAVFRAWTDPKSLARWYAPQGCTIEFHTLDVRSGGSFHSCVVIPDGKRCWCRGEYLEVVAPQRIVYTMEVCDEHGAAADPVAMGMDSEWPKTTTVTVSFIELEAGRTKLTLQQTVRRSLAEKTGAYPSWLSMLDLLAAELARK